MVQTSKQTRVEANFQTSQAERTEEGYLVTHGTLAKPGIMLYKRKDGTTYRELTPRSVLKQKAYLDSFEGRPIIDEHPPGIKLNIKDVNRQRPLCGTAGRAFYDDTLDAVRAPLYLNTPHGVAQYDAGKRTLSPCYPVFSDPTPGVDPEFGEYDTIQRWRGPSNHIALAKNPRGGLDMKADSMDADTSIQVSMQADSQDPTPPAPPATPPAGGATLDALMAGQRETNTLLKQLIESMGKTQADDKTTPPVKPEEKPITMNADSLNAAVAERAEIVSIAGKGGVQLDMTQDNMTLKRTLLAQRYQGIMRADSQDVEVNVLWQAFRKEQGATTSASGGTTGGWEPVSNAFIQGTKMRADSMNADQKKKAMKPVTLDELADD